MRSKATDRVRALLSAGRYHLDTRHEITVKGKSVPPIAVTLDLDGKVEKGGLAGADKVRISAPTFPVALREIVVTEAGLQPEHFPRIMALLAAMRETAFLSTNGVYLESDWQSSRVRPGTTCIEVGGEDVLSNTYTAALTTGQAHWRLQVSVGEGEKAAVLAEVLGAKTFEPFRGQGF